MCISEMSIKEYSVPEDIKYIKIPRGTYATPVSLTKEGAITLKELPRNTHRDWYCYPSNVLWYRDTSLVIVKFPTVVELDGKRCYGLLCGPSRLRFIHK